MYARVFVCIIAVIRVYKYKQLLISTKFAVNNIILAANSVAVIRGSMKCPSCIRGCRRGCSRGCSMCCIRGC